MSRQSSLLTFFSKPAEKNHDGGNPAKDTEDRPQVSASAPSSSQGKTPTLPADW